MRSFKKMLIALSAATVAFGAMALSASADGLSRTYSVGDTIEAWGTKTAIESNEYNTLKNDPTFRITFTCADENPNVAVYLTVFDEDGQDQWPFVRYKIEKDTGNCSRKRESTA